MSQTQPVPQDQPPAVSFSNAEKARALIALLEKGGTEPGNVPPERLRDWAADLIRTVERGKAEPMPATAPPANRLRLFTKSPPRLAAAVSPATPPRSAISGRLTLTAPMPHRPSIDPVPAVEAIKLSRDEVLKLAEETVDPTELLREHTAIIALTLLGKPILEQATALRRLPGRQVRAVHRALRQMETDKASVSA